MACYRNAMFVSRNRFSIDIHVVSKQDAVLSIEEALIRAYVVLYEACEMLFSTHSLSSVSCTNEYLDPDSGKINDLVSE